MIKQKHLIIILLVIPVLFLSACWDLDPDLVEEAFESWAEKNDLLENGQWKPEGVVVKAIENTIADATNQDTSVQLEGLDVIRDIEKADNLAAEALTDFDTGKISSAVSIRPLDWRLHEQEGVVWTANGNGAAAETAWAQSDELLKESLLRGGDCATQRRSQLEVRLMTLWEAVTTYESQPGRSQGDAVELRAAHKNVSNELQWLNINRSDFCDLHGND